MHLQSENMKNMQNTHTQLQSIKKKKEPGTLEIIFKSHLTWYNMM